jgi:hypothetical protein
MKRILLIIIYVGFRSVLFGQVLNSKEYHSFIGKADSLYKIKDYKNAALNYSKAFEANGWKGFSWERYNAACCWALIGNVDSSFFNLERIANKANYSDYFEIMNERALNTLHNDVRWNALIDKIKQNRYDELSNIKLPGGNYVENIDKPLIILLDSLVFEDKKWRKYSEKNYKKKPLDDTISIETINNNIARTDSLNYIQCLKIFSQYGYPDYKIAGKNGSDNFCYLVVQQDNHPDFQNAVAKMMKIAVDEGLATNYDYAYLIDRVKVNTNQLQIYGTQKKLKKDSNSYEPMPLIDPEKVNERRKSMGLPPIEEDYQKINTKM